MPPLAKRQTAPAPNDTPLASVLPSSAFPGRVFLRCDEVAKAVECSPQHVADLCHEGTIRGAVNVAGTVNSRRISCWRIPVASYEAWIKRKSNIEAYQE